MTNIQYDLKDDDILFFSHIPKTAGTTFINILDKFFSNDSIYPEQLWTEFRKQPHVNFSKYKLIRGHFTKDLVQYLPKIPICITMLRDPMDRTLSYYAHLLRHGVINNETLSDIFLSPNNSITSFENYQTHWIAIHPYDYALITKHGPEIDDYHKNKKIKSIICSRSDDKILESAKQSLSNFAFFGLTERLEDSLYLLCYIFGWKPIRNIPMLNTSSNRITKEELSEEVKQSILECTRLDARLYQYASQLFQQRFSDMVKDLREKYFQERFSNLPMKEMMLELLEAHHNKRVMMKDSLNFSN